MFEPAIPNENDEVGMDLNERMQRANWLIGTAIATTDDMHGCLTELGLRQMKYGAGQLKHYFPQLTQAQEGNAAFPNMDFVEGLYRAMQLQEALSPLLDQLGGATMSQAVKVQFLAMLAQEATKDDHTNEQSPPGLNHNGG